ncbi:MAG: CoB--CoM heterodisulfide reductase iron-sulfur subunit A family protein [Chitinispirillaceae bacterium]|nr:CoB--CoM heterodisulfide reductase iron-sulfur subunit A family protein [Chitinispirillaceae bacterium]
MNGKKTKIALFLCKCGANIADFIDLKEIESRFSGNDTTSFVETQDLLCSPAGKKNMLETIEKNKPDFVVVAACSPQMHEKTFQEVVADAGINMARMQMANIREQSAWVTTDKKKATLKAIALINAAMERSVLHDDLQPKTMECLTDLIIIGGGMAGIEAALLAANAGRKVTIVEKEISLGGSVIKIEEVAPNMECAPCLLSPRLAAVRDNKNIRVISNASVTDVLGFFGNFKVKIKRMARYVKESCIGCEACFEVCPVTVDNDFNLGLGTKKAISTLFAGSVPAAAAIDKTNCLHFTDGSCNACAAVCPFQSIDFEDTGEDIEVSAGAVIVATGCTTVNPSTVPETGYGKIENVYSMPEFERIASSNGPYGGEIRLKNGEPPRSVAVIHCVGSLSDGGVPYCSGICCMTAIKTGELLRKKNPDVEVYSIHDRLVFNGPEQQAFFEKQKEEGTHFVKTERLRDLRVVQNGTTIEISGPDFQPIAVDMVVLSTGLTPQKGTLALARMLNADLTDAGFFKADHPILRAIGSSIDGVYTAGCCASPCDVTTAITRAQAAAGDAISKLVPGRKIALEVMTTIIDEIKCAGCKLCIAVCPYKAIDFDGQKKVCVVNEAICRGCGTCAATCPGGAARAIHFSDQQIMAEIGGLLHG